VTRGMDCGHILSHLVFTLAPFLFLATESTYTKLCTSYTTCIVRLLCKRTDTLVKHDYRYYVLASTISAYMEQTI
jgi:hypothetical protein